MPSIAESLRAQTHRRALDLSVAERIDRALDLGDDDARLFAAVRHIEIAAARRELARTRHLGRPSSCAAADRP